MHYWLEQGSEKANYARQALQLLAKEFPNGEHEHRETCESLLAHAQAVLRYKCRSENDMRHRAALLYNVGWFNWRQGRYVSAYQAVSESYNIYQERAGDIATTTLNSLGLLASVLRNQGKYEAAEEMNRRALEGKEKVLGVKHPSTLTSVSNLASVLKYLGKYEAAEEIDRQAAKRITLPSSSTFKDSDQSDSSETTSIASSAWSEFSKSSASSYASASDISAAALDGVIAVFMSDEKLRCLFAEAFTKQDRDRVSRKGARLLKRLGRRLVMAANTPAEKKAASFFFSRRRDQAIIDKIAQGITTISSGEERQEQAEEEVGQQEATKQERLELYLQQQMEKPTINLESEETPALATETIDDHWTSFGKDLNDGGSDASSDSEDEDKDKQQTVQLNIDAVKLFLKSSDAFARFKEEFEDFINPFRNEAMWTKTLWNGRERVRFEHSSNVPRLTNIDKLKIAAEEKLGMPILWWPLKQPRKHLSSSKIRIIWICVGHRSIPHLESSTNQRARNVVMKHTQTSLVLKHEDISSDVRQKPCESHSWPTSHIADQ